jgi:hypothetical protein
MIIELIERSITNKPKGNVKERLIDEQSIRDYFDQLTSASGILLLTFHGGLITLRRKLFGTFERGLTFGLEAAKDPSGKLFVAMRAIEDGQAVLIAPDGPFGKRSGTLNVLGMTTPAGEGGAFLAYATSCKTAWYSVEWEDRRLVPKLESGPRRQADESYSDFKNRLFSFCSEKIEASLTGDPRNIALRGGQWKRLVKQRVRETRE